MRHFKTILAAAATILGLAVLVTSCSDNKKATPEATPAAAEVVGNYTGDMSVSVMGMELPFEGLTFSLSKEDDSTVSLTTPSFTYTSMTLPEITITDLNVSGADGSYSLAEKEFSGTTSDGKAYSGTVKGSVTDNVLTLNMSLQYGSMPMAMIISFTGNKN